MRVATACASALVPCAFALILAPALPAQIRASETASVSQTVDGTKITIEYSRPRARGRKEIFGTKDVKWNEVWTPGANYATTLDVSNDIRLDGHAVPKGKYSLWMVVRESGPWTLVLDPRARLFHEVHPDSAANQLRFPITAQSAPFTEVLTFSFPGVTASGTTLAMSWIKTRVSVRIDVAPSLVVQLAEADAAPYLGTYTFAPMSKDDSAKTEQDKLIVSYDDGTLKAAFDPIDSYMKTFALIRIAPDTFAPGLYDARGAIYEVLRPDFIFEFKRNDGRATRVDLRDDNDKLQGTATRP